MKSNKVEKKSNKSQKKSNIKQVSIKNGKQKKPGPDKKKKMLRVPGRLRREPFKTLMISKRQIPMKEERDYAFKIKELGGEYPNFLKLDLTGEIMNNSAHKVGMPTRFSSTLYGPPVNGALPRIHYLYKTYNFLDDLTKYDIFRRAAHYAPMLGRRKKATDAFRLAGMAVCANFELRRRREKFRIRGRWRPEYSNYGRRMLESPRVMVTKMMKIGQPYFGQLITKKKQEIKAMMDKIFEKSTENFTSKERETKDRFSKFSRHNKDWMLDRMKCQQKPIFMKFNRDRTSRTVVNRHFDMPWRRRGDQDLFSEFNYLSSHLAFTAHFCRVVNSFSVNLAKEDEVIKKTTTLTPLIRIRNSRYSYFPAVSVVNYNHKEELQLTLPRLQKRAPSIAEVSGFSSDSQESAATSTPLDWEFDWKIMSKVPEHRQNTIGEITHQKAYNAAEKHFAARKWREMDRRKLLLYKENRRFELQNTVPIFKEISKIHPPLIYCKLKGMELNKLRRSTFSEDIDPNERIASAYLCKQRIDFLEKTLPCKDDPRIHMTPGWKVFATRENPDTFPNVARILKQRSSWVSKNCLSRAATVPRCDKLPMNIEGRNRRLFLVLILPLTVALMGVTFGMISFL